MERLVISTKFLILKAMHSIDQKNTKAVTTLVEHDVLPGKEKIFEEWVKTISLACSRYSGFMGTEIVKDVTCDTNRYVSIFRFDSLASLNKWMQSPERANLVALCSDFTKSKLSQYHSLEFLFPADEAEGLPPSREKMAVVTFIGLIAPVYYIPPLVKQFITETPIFITFASLTIITPMMVYIIMPILTRLAKRWLFRK